VIQNLQPRIHALILRDELSIAGNELDQPERSELVLEHDPRFRITTAKAGYGEAVRAARAYHPDVIVIEGVHTDPVELVAELDESVQKVPVIVILDEADRSRAHECVVAGARGCLVRPVDPSILVETIVQAYDRATRRRKQLEAEFQTSAAQGGRLIVVRGAKGGVGGTVVATNLAVAIRRLTGERVALVDAHPFGGDIALALNLVPARTLADLIPHLNSLDDDLLASAMTPHQSGVNVLAAPFDPEHGDMISAEQFYKVLEGVRARHDYVIVDSGPSVDPNSITALDMAELLLLVSSPELAALKNAGQFIQLGAKLGYSEAKMRLVVNRQKIPGGIPRADFERHLAYRMSFGIPDDRTMIRSLTRGEPLVTLQRTSRAARALDRLARTVVANAGWEGEAGLSSRGGPFKLRLPSLSAFSRSNALTHRPEGAR
jgi:pilus assembly protein CpaE